MTLDEKLRLIFGYSDQAFTEVAKVPDDIVSPDLKAYVVTQQSRARRVSFPAFRGSESPIRRKLTHRSVFATASYRAPLCPLRWPRPRVSIRRSPGGRRNDRRRSPGDRPQHHAVGRREPRPRAEERPQLRIYRRRSASCRNHGRGVDHGIQSNHIISTIKHYAVNDRRRSARRST